MDDLIIEIKNLKSIPVKDSYVLMNKDYSPILIDKKNFYQISNLNVYDNSLELTFIDGGQAILFEGASFCIGVIRVAAITYVNNSRVSKNLDEFNVLVLFKGDNFVVKTFPKSNFNELSFDSNDESLKFGNERATPSRILSIIRRLAELNLASKFDNSVIDGTLEARYPYEINYIKNLKNAFAISKSCSLITNNGVGITDYLRNLMDGKWFYYPIVKNNNPLHPAETGFVKLHNDSDYVFRFEFMNNIDFKKVLGEINSLSLNSMDPVFLGYPYGLIDVDQYARITENEKKTLQTKIWVKLGKERNQFSKLLTSMNSHEILDHLKF